jgi:hypothetical protein
MNLFLIVLIRLKYQDMHMHHDIVPMNSLLVPFSQVPSYCLHSITLLTNSRLSLSHLNELYSDSKLSTALCHA